ncbi:Uncharacterized protein Rs2_09845 [Raphanus sativus]|nr:Uncharacterized protein Rs2_09845 [Raphanus sativus]
MGRVFRIWRGDWKKNGQEQWHFVPNHQDYGFAMYMDSPETLEVIDATVREKYMLGLATPVLITYGMPDWMMFPSGPSPPITVATTSDLVSLITRRPPPAEITLLLNLEQRKLLSFNSCLVLISRKVLQPTWSVLLRMKDLEQVTRAWFWVKGFLRVRGL